MLDRFSYDIVHTPGKELFAADTVPRAPLTAAPKNLIHEDGAKLLMEICIDHLPASTKLLEKAEKHRQQIMFALWSKFMQTVVAW